MVVWVAENKIKLVKSIKIKRKKSQKINIKHEYSQSLCQKLKNNLIHKLIWNVKNDRAFSHTKHAGTCSHAQMDAWSWPVNQHLTGWNLSHISALPCSPMGTHTDSILEQRRSGGVSQQSSPGATKNHVSDMCAHQSCCFHWNLKKVKKLAFYLTVLKW